MKLREVDFCQSGTYYCHATNCHGTSVLSCRVTVTIDGPTGKRLSTTTLESTVTVPVTKQSQMQQVGSALEAVEQQLQQQTSASLERHVSEEKNEAIRESYEKALAQSPEAKKATKEDDKQLSEKEATTTEQTDEVVSKDSKWARKHAEIEANPKKISEPDESISISMVVTDKAASTFTKGSEVIEGSDEEKRPRKVFI